ncbi:kinase-like domain-containing protein [Scleroderma yunnanense]
MSETIPLLQQLAQRATERGVNLNHSVDRDDSFRPLYGGNAIVYKGTMRPEGKQVAVKSLRLSPSQDKAAGDRIIEEIRRWSTLQHDNIVPVFGVATEFDYAVSIISEWVPKGNAYDYVQDLNHDPRPLVLEMGKGLHYLHSHGFLHGDLRAHNVLISANGHALLVDYGLSALVDSSFSMTAAAPIRPTIRWMAPEQIDNYGKVTTQADVWAFGMTVLELFTRQPPYLETRDTRGVIQRISKESPNRPTNESTCGRMTDQWWEICCLCWERDELSRPPIADIVAIIEKAELSPHRRKSFRIPIYATLFAASALTLSYFLTRSA